jgi:UDP-N-acetylmuramate--alanine ligase
MHIYFSGIGGTAISSLALIAHEAGYEVSGSDARPSGYLEYLKEHGISNTHIGVDDDFIAAAHAENPIDWFVYGSAQPMDFPDHPEFDFCRRNGIKMSKRDEFLSQLIKDKNLKLIAVAGTHGKTTTTAISDAKPLAYCTQKSDGKLKQFVGFVLEKSADLYYFMHS